VRRAIKAGIEFDETIARGEPFPMRARLTVGGAA
jgi:hypothetical protein